MFLCRCRRSKVGDMGFLKLISQAFPRPLPQSPLVFPALSLALFFARPPLSERLEQTSGTMTCLLARIGYFARTDVIFEERGPNSWFTNKTKKSTSKPMWNNQRHTYCIFS